MKRRITQLLSAVLANSYFLGWKRGSIYQGSLKQVCVPFLNCYSCPGALGACPVGAFQSLLAARTKTFSLYILGFLAAVGALGGRFVCGWLCPFGLVQELLHKLSRLRLQIPRLLELGKYLVLILTLALPLLWRNPLTGLAEPYFCKFICPAGTLEAGIPLTALNPNLAALTGWLFSWKVLFLLIVLVVSIFIWRPFCRTLCPLGAFYGLLNRFSIWRLRVDTHQCVNCGACSRACKAALTPYRNPNSGACVRCLECISACPTHALSFSRDHRVGIPNRHSARPPIKLGR
ncbi:MAG: 4Fe-4S binding protein [Bacillota bacterium]|jgi:ferredoxin-type protein NapH